MSCQTQSPLISLPGELRNEIFNLALIADEPVVNPYFGPSTLPKHRHVPQLGAAVARTCHALHGEMNLAPLFKQNTFTFTRVSHVHAFAQHLTREQMRWIRSVTIDLREAALGYANDGPIEAADVISNEWLHYLSCSHHAHMPGVWCSKLSTLDSDLPDIKELVVDLTKWQSPFAGTRKNGWKYLQRLLCKVRGLESIKLTSKCLDYSCWNPKPVPWDVGPWFSPAFSNDDTSLLELLGAGLRDAEANETKVFAWKVQDGITSLEVKILPSGIASLAARASCDKKIPENGTAVWDDFLDLRNRREQRLSKGIR